MKKLLSIVLTLAIVAIGLSACSTQDNGNGFEKTGTLKVATSPDFAPMEFIDPTKSGQDKYVGFDITLSRYIAEQLGMDLEIMPMSFDASQVAVSTGKVDMAISGFSWTEKRAQNYNISDYYQAGENETEQTVITLKSNQGKYDTLESFDGTKVGAQAESLQAALCEDQLIGSQLVTIGDINTGILQLKKGDFDCMVVADGNADVIIKSNPDIVKSKFKFEIDPKYTDNVILLKKGNDELLAKVNGVLAQAKEAGLYEKWYNEALNTVGVGVSFDDNGNIIEEDANAEPAKESSIISNVIMLWKEYWKVFIFEGVVNTLKLTTIVVFLGALLGVVVTMLKRSKFKIVRFLITAYVEIIRGTPMLLQIFLFYFVLANTFDFLNFSTFTWIVIALCINSSAYVSEVFRSGIQSVDKGQTEAARSLGLSERQTMIKIILPQAIKNILPALGNEFIMILKDTSLASTFFVGEIMTVYLNVKGATFLPLEGLIITGILYFCLTFPLSKLVAAFERKMSNEK